MPGRPPPAPGKGAGRAAPVVPGAAAAAAAPAKYAGGGGNAIPPPGRRGGCACSRAIHRQKGDRGAEGVSNAAVTDKWAQWPSRVRPPCLLVLSDHCAAAVLCCGLSAATQSEAGGWQCLASAPSFLDCLQHTQNSRQNKKKRWEWVECACSYMLVLFILLSLFCGVW